MIIVSQDKTRVLNFNNILSIYTDKDETKKKIYAFSTNGEVQAQLGEYKTEERTKEILEEIVQEYLDSNEESFGAKFGYVKNTIYEMPLE